MTKKIAPAKDFEKPSLSKLFSGKFACIVGVHPHVNFDRTKAELCAFCRPLAILKIITMFIAEATFITMRSSNLDTGMATTIWVVLEGFLFIMETGVTSSVLLASSFGSITEWNKIVEFLLRNKYFMQHVDTTFKLSIFLKMVVPLVYFVANGTLWILAIGFDQYRFYILRDLQRCYVHIAFVFYIFVIYLIKKGFEELNVQTEEVCRDICLQRKLKLNGLKSFTKFKLRSVYDICKLSASYRVLCEVVDAVNNLFGWQCLFLIGQGSAVLLQSLYMLVNIVQNKVITEKGNLLLFLNVINAVFVVLLVTTISMLCDSTLKQSRRSMLLCHFTQDDFDNNSDERKELHTFMQMGAHISSEITAARFFKLDRSSIFKIFSFTTTYFIIMIQFHNNA